MLPKWLVNAFVSICKSLGWGVGGRQRIGENMTICDTGGGGQKMPFLYDPKCMLFQNILRNSLIERFNFNQSKVQIF